MPERMHDPWFYRMLREIDGFRSYRGAAGARRHPMSHYLALRLLDVLSRLEQLPRAYGRG